VKRAGPGSRSGRSTRADIVDATIRTLRERGFAGASARAIAQAGGFSQSQVFYHFGSVADVLLAALDETSARRLARYREAVDGATSLPELVRVAADVYREDLEQRHIAVLAEMIAGSSTIPGLGGAIAERMDPWLRFTEEAVRRITSGSPFEQLVPAPELAHGIVALYLGLELLTHLNGDRAPAERLFQVALGIAPIAAALVGRPERSDG
jgi:AcrR family transcriptional regulator